MKTLLSLMTKMVARAFHAFVQGRLRAEVSDPDIIPLRDSIDPAVENRLAPQRQRQPRESKATPIHWAELSPSSLPTIGVL